MKSIKIFYIPIFTSICLLFNQILLIASSEIDIFERIIYLDSTVVMSILNDTNNRTFIIRIFDKSTDYLHAINGCGDCYIDLTDSSNILMQRNFNKGNLPTFTLEAGIMASTYGATDMFIIWQEQVWKTWNIYKIPFELVYIRKKENFDEIIRINASNEEEIYYFKDGLLCR